MSPYVALIFWITLGALCAYIASNRGRNIYAWFFLGLFLGVFALLTVLLLPKKNVAPVEPAVSLSPAAAIAAPPPELPKISQKFWYYLGKENIQHGPMSFDALTNEWKLGTVQAATLVWNEDLEEWKKFQELPDFEFLVKN